MTWFVGIDPSTKTGIVALNDFGEVAKEKEIQLVNGIYSTVQEIQNYAHKIVSHLEDDAIVCIEGFSFGSKGQAVSTQYGIGFAIRFALEDRGIKYYNPSPSQVKKFATGKGNITKDNMVLPINRLWDYEHPSDNVRDAFVLAQMARAVVRGTSTTNYQREAVAGLLDGNGAIVMRKAKK